MNWSEERYVKVFTRDTPTWLAWPWQARAIAPLLMRKLENSGRLAVGRLEPARAVALTIHLPIEVVEVGLPAMLEDGTLELRPDGLWWPRFEEAQESRKSDALNSREYRARQRRESSTPTRQTASDGVRERQTPSASSTAQHSTAQHDLAPSSELDPPPASFMTVFGHWQRVMGKPDAKPIDKRRRAVAARLREGYTVEQLKQAVDGCARTPHNMGQNERHERYDDLELICRNGAQVERFMRNANAASHQPESLAL